MSEHNGSPDLIKALSDTLTRTIESGDIAQLKQFQKEADRGIAELQERPRKKNRGMGRIFKRGSTWWIGYSHRGKEYRESSGSNKETEATKLLKKRMGEMGHGRFVGPTEEKVTFDEMAEDLRRDYKVNARKAVDAIEFPLSHLEESFEGASALDITTDKVNEHISRRQGEKASNGTINREMAALKRMFSLAIQAGKLSRKPHIPTLEEHNARQGFLEHASFVGLRDNLPVHLQGPVTFLYYSGWRVSEMRALEWRDVDLNGKVIRLRPEISKNKDGRVLPLSGEILATVKAAAEERRPEIPYVFHHERRPIGDFGKAWATACKTAGLAGIIVHDMRRTAVRNLVRAGVPERVAMAITGHKTRAVFDRYNIVSEADLMMASERLQSHIDRQPKQAVVVSIQSREKKAS